MEKISNILKNQKTWPESTGNSSNSKPKPCPKCGQEIEPQVIPLAEREVYPACVCEVEEYEREEDRKALEKKQEKVSRALKSSGLGKRFRGCSFENWKEREGTQKAHRAALEYKNNLKENIGQGKGLIVFGQPGNGKSHLVAAIVNEAIREGYVAVFEGVPRLLAKIRATYSGGTTSEGEIMQALTEADLLVLDDAGAEKLTAWTEPTLYTIIDDRYIEEKPVVITTNSDLDGLEEKLGYRAMDRLLEMCEIVENRGTSYRQERGR